jgi:hypothetical protein
LGEEGPAGVGRRMIARELVAQPVDLALRRIERDARCQPPDDT